MTAAAVFGLGIWLALPRGVSRGRRGGIIVAMAAVAGAFGAGVYAGRLPIMAGWATDTVFYVLAAVTLLSGLAAVTLRSPVYCALWFAMALLGTAGLMLYQGAQFLGLATVVVYAGAIVVTFLFVLMLAQPEGHSYYDRLSWDAGLSAGAGALIVGVLTVAIVSSLAGQPIAAGPSPEQLQRGVLADDHVARLGGLLFSQQLVAVEVAGVLLMAALVGAAAIVGTRRRVPSPDDAVGSSESGARP